MIGQRLRFVNQLWSLMQIVAQWIGNRLSLRNGIATSTTATTHEQNHCCTDLVVIVHTGQISPALISSDFYQPLSCHTIAHITSTFMLATPYRTKHDPKDEPPVAPHYCPAGGRVTRETIQAEQRAHEDCQEPRLQEL